MTRPATSRIDKLLASMRYSYRADLARMARGWHENAGRGRVAGCDRADPGHSPQTRASLCTKMEPDVRVCRKRELSLRYRGVSEPKGIYWLLFASDQVDVFRKSLIRMRPSYQWF